MILAVLVVSPLSGVLAAFVRVVPVVPDAARSTRDHEDFENCGDRARELASLDAAWGESF